MLFFNKCEFQASHCLCHFLTAKLFTSIISDHIYLETLSINPHMKFKIIKQFHLLSSMYVTQIWFCFKRHTLLNIPFILIVQLFYKSKLWTIIWFCSLYNYVIVIMTHFHFSQDIKLIDCKCIYLFTVTHSVTPLGVCISVEVYQAPLSIFYTIHWFQYVVFIVL